MTLGNALALSRYQVFVLRDGDPQPDSEAMNSRDDPDRVAVRTGKVNFSGSGFEYSFAPFAVILLELQMRQSGNAEQ